MRDDVQVNLEGRAGLPLPAPKRSRLILRMLAATILTGLASGIGGTVLTLILHLVQHVAFGYTEQTFLVGVERASSSRRVLALAGGGVLVGMGWWLHRRRVDVESVSVTHALREPKPRLPMGATFTDASLQVVAVGAGASLGREGAPRQMGAATGGWIAARLNVTDVEQRRLLACGAGAGLAAVYNVPLAGAAFTLEILLTSFALADVIPAVLTAAIGTAVAWPILSDHPIYRIAPVHLGTPVLVWSLLLGPVAGVLGVTFVRLTNAARTHSPSGWRMVVAVVVTFSALGALAIRYPQLLGNGKGAAGLAFDGSLSLGLAGAVMLLKPLATAACLGSGAIGGLLTPALASGAAFGIFTGRLWTMIWPGASPAQYAIIGAAALVAVTQRAPITAIILTLELVDTGQALLVPIMVATALGTTSAWLIDHRMAPVMLTAPRPPPH